MSIGRRVTPGNGWAGYWAEVSNFNMAIDIHNISIFVESAY